MGLIYIIEGACTGNFGRSTAFEEAAKRAVKANKKLEGRIKIISSGTGVQRSRRVDIDLETIFRLLTWSAEFISQYKGKKYVDAFSQKEKELIADAVSNRGLYEHLARQNLADVTNLRSYALRGIEMLRRKEGKYRDSALARAGLEYTGEPKQTVPRPDVHLFLGMEQKHVDAAQKIYEGRIKKPVFATLPDYACEPQRQIPDLINSAKFEDYKRNIMTIVELAEKAVHRFGVQYGLL
jgi:protein-tyrosine-phosphatase